jgi:hypothetical protein
MPEDSVSVHSDSATSRHSVESFRPPVPPKSPAPSIGSALGLSTGMGPLTYVLTSVNTVAKQSQTARNTVSRATQVGSIVSFMLAVSALPHHVLAGVIVGALFPLVGMVAARVMQKRLNNDDTIKDFRAAMDQLKGMDIDFGGDVEAAAGFKKALEVNKFLEASKTQLLTQGVAKAYKPLAKYIKKVPGVQYAMNQAAPHLDKMKAKLENLQGQSAVKDYAGSVHVEDAIEGTFVEPKTVHISPPASLGSKDSSTVLNDLEKQASSSDVK